MDAPRWVVLTVMVLITLLVAVPAFGATTTYCQVVTLPDPKPCTLGNFFADKRVPESCRIG